LRLPAQLATGRSGLLIVGIVIGTVAASNETETSTVAVPSATAPCETEAVELYMADVRRELDGLATAIYEVGEFFTAAGPNSVLFLDEDWLVTMILQLLAVELHLDAVEALTAPPLLDGMHNLLLVAMDEYQQFVDAAVKGIDNLDATELLRAQDYMEEATMSHNLSDAAWQLACEWPPAGRHRWGSRRVRYT